ncbi:MAG: Gfo/Idh/MocA family oxidoreductase [Acidimicrobiales bacterium]|nr:Gfo/Idh/MocA family oxidoreductase [Acidimicrobiales bacterium]
MTTDVALIGCGYWGKNIARSLASIGRLAAIVDDDPVRAKEFAAAHDCDALTLEEVLADPSVPAVAIATPAETHFALAEKALNAGKNVFIEKPMALKAEHAETLNQLAERTGRTLMVGHLLQYHDGFIRLREMVQSGELGRLQYVYSNRLNFGKIRREEDVLWSFAPHDISMILALAGEEPSQVNAQGLFVLHGRIADTTTTHLQFPSGLGAHIFVSWLHPFKEQKLVVVGEKAMAVFDDREPLDRKLAIYRAEVSWLDGAPVAPKVEPDYEVLPSSEPLVNELQHFVDCCETGATPRTSGREGQRVLAVLNQATSQLLEQNHSRRRTDGLSLPGFQTASPGELNDLEKIETSTASRRDGVHPTAIVDDSAVVGTGTKIWHFSHVMGNTSIGANCNIGQNVVAGPNVSIGAGVRIQNNVSVYDGVTLEDDVFCGPSMVFTNVNNPRAFISRKDEFARTLIKKGASLGANCTIVCGTTVGEYAFVGAGAVVAKDVPPYALVVGVPARQTGWVSREGEVLGADLTCPRTGETYEEINGELHPIQTGAMA